MKRKKREGMTDHFLPSSYQFIPRSLCMIIRGRVKNHDDTVISPVNTVTENRLIIIRKSAPVAIAQLTSSSHARLAAGGGEKSGFHVDPIVLSAVDRP